MSARHSTAADILFAEALAPNPGQAPVQLQRGEDHPSCLAFHAFNNGLQILLLMQARIGADAEGSYTRARILEDLKSVTELFTQGEEHLTRVDELLESSESDLDAARRVTDGQETQLRDMRDEQIAYAQEVNEHRRRTARVTEFMESATRMAMARTASMSEEYTSMRSMYHDLTSPMSGFARPRGATPATPEGV